VRSIAVISARTILTSCEWRSRSFESAHWREEMLGGDFARAVAAGASR